MGKSDVLSRILSRLGGREAASGKLLTTGETPGNVEPIEVHVEWNGARWVDPDELLQRMTDSGLLKVLEQVPVRTSRSGRADVHAAIPADRTG